MIAFTSVVEIRERIAQFEERFKDLKRQTREGLERLGPLASVQVVVERLTDLGADNKPEHKVFLQGNLHIMFRAENHFELYGILNFYWDYLAYNLLDHLIREFSIREVKGEMEEYKIDLKRFRRATPLKLFYQAQRRRRRRPPAEFREMAVEFDWPDTVTLEVVEDFRQAYESHYSLRECAMMLVSLSIGSFVITWIVPESIIESLKTKLPEKLFKRHSVTKLQIAGDLIYPSTQHQNVRISHHINNVHTCIHQLNISPISECHTVLTILLCLYYSFYQVPVLSPSPSTSHQPPAAQYVTIMITIYMNMQYYCYIELFMMREICVQYNAEQVPIPRHMIRHMIRHMTRLSQSRSMTLLSNRRKISSVQLRKVCCYSLTSQPAVVNTYQTRLPPRYREGEGPVRCA